MISISWTKQTSVPCPVTGYRKNEHRYHQSLIFNKNSVYGIFLFDTASRPALGPTQTPIQCVPGVLSLGGKAAEA